MNKYKILINHVDQELKEFKEIELLKSKEEIFQDYYKIHFFEMYAEFFKNAVYDYYELLLKIKYPLSFLYSEWLSSDGYFSEDWDDLKDFLDINFGSYKDN